MPRNSSIPHFDGRQPLSHLSWLDLYPATNEALPHRTNTRLTERVNKIKETLGLIKLKIDIRRQLVALTEKNGAYCTACGSLPVTSYCGVTCPLLRARSGPWLKRDAAWVYFAKKDTELYEKLSCDINTFGFEADKQMVVKWEVACTDLLQRTQDCQHRYSTRLTMPFVRGFNQSWTFEGRWGKGPGLQAGLAPDEAEPPVLDGMESFALHEVRAPDQDEMQDTEKQDKTELVATSGFCLSSTFADWTGVDGRKLH